MDDNAGASAIGARNGSKAWLRATVACAITAAILSGCGGGGGASEPDKAEPLASTRATPLDAPANDTVSTRFGPVQGNVYSGGVEFLGIPFAKSPAAALRWKPPQDPDPWSSVLATRAFKPACPQKRFEQGKGSYTLEGDEDCLYLNVWTPGAGLTPLPVLVFIHGGGQQQGSTGQISGGTQIFNGRNMAARGQAVIVTIEYRLGPLGYLVHPGLESETASGSAGNYGVMDQIHALKWVKANIGAFGGDAQRVLVFGESAGGINAGNMLLTPLASGLFQRADVQSAVPHLGNYADARAAGVDFVNGFTTAPNDAAKIAAMRALDWRPMIATESDPGEGGIVQMTWQPVVDRVVFPADPATAFQTGRFNRVPMLIGSNADEASLSAPSVVTPGMVTALVAAIVPAGYRSQALQLYPPGSSNDEARKSYVQILTDTQFTSTVRRSARQLAPQQAEPVWRYFFTHRHAGAPSSFGSYHGIELFYVFNTWENASMGPFTPDDAAVQSQMLAYWVNFARTGDPNAPGMVPWPRFDGGTDCYLEIAAVMNGSQCGVRSAKSDFWDLMSSLR